MKASAAETEGIFVQIGLKIFLGQAMIGSQDKYRGVADDDVQPVEQARIGLMGFVPMSEPLHRWDIAAVTIATNRAALGK